MDDDLCAHRDQCTFSVRLKWYCSKKYYTLCSDIKHWFQMLFCISLNFAIITVQCILTVCLIHWDDSKGLLPKTVICESRTRAFTHPFLNLLLSVISRQQFKANESTSSPPSCWCCVANVLSHTQQWLHVTSDIWIYSSSWHSYTLVWVTRTVLVAH